MSPDVTSRSGGLDRLIAPGVVSIAVPIEGSDLSEVFVYGLDSGSGVVLVDGGWNGEDSLRRLDEGLGLLGRSVADVTAVLVTHNHSDHYGLVGRIKQQSGAWIGMHAADAAQLELRYGSRELFRSRLSAWLTRCGVPADRLDELSTATMWQADDVPVTAPDRMIADRDVIEVGELRIEAVHTPGHSPGHLCFSLPSAQLIFTGDHVMPKITPNVSAGPLGSGDPLAAYLESLRLVRRFDGARALPAHVGEVAALVPRLDEIADHHARRLDETVQVVADGHSTVWDVATTLRWSRPLDRFPAFLQRAALGETDAHLQRLRATAQLTCAPGEPDRWTTSRGSRGMS